MPIRGEATCRLADRRTLTLKLNFATLARVAEQLDVPLKQVFAILKDQHHPRQGVASVVLLEQALQRYHPDLGEDEVGDLMLSDDVALGEALMKAFAGAFGKGETEDRKPANPRRARSKAGTSTSSRSRGPKQG